MKRLKLIYNPNAGDKSFKNNLDAVIAEFQRGGFSVSVFRSMFPGDIFAHLAESDKDYDTIAVSGGDGSVSLVTDAMIKYNIKAKLGIIPSGTANDFAAFLNIPANPAQAAEVINAGKTILSDVGIVNGKHFVNVCAAGNFVDISFSVDQGFKNYLGKLAYYLKAMEQLTKLMPLSLRITSSKEVYEGNFYLFLILNSAGAGGFSSIVDIADISDGMFDFVAVREGKFAERTSFALDLFSNEHLCNSSVLYFKDSIIKVEQLLNNEGEKPNKFTLDGEEGDFLPITVKNLPKAVEIYIA